MKKYLYLLCSLVMLLSACQQEQDFSNGNIGYLRLDLGVNTSAISRAETPYNPKQIAVQIIAKDGEIVKQTNDWTEWEGEQIALPVGTYTLKASSAGFDGKTSGFDKPYYAGSAEINIEKDKEVNETVICTLANVKVTVIFDQSFIDAFKEADVTVDDNSENAGIAALKFVMGQENKSAYFPVTDLKATVNVLNKQDVQNSQTDTIKNVQARDHYILKYKVGEITGGNVSISIDETTRTYTYNVTISTQPKTTLTVSSANAWAKFAYLEGTAVTTESLEPTKMVMEYRQKNTEEWTPLVTTVEEGTYKAKVEGLTPATQYECRMVYGEEEYVSAVTEFTTEIATALYNGNFDLWSTVDKTIYPGSSEEAGNTTSFWNTSNPGTSQGRGAIGGAVNPTTYVTSPVHTSGEGAYAAKLESTYKLIKFAAASLYTGNFLGLSGMSANMEFGKPFTGRPIALHGFYKYIPKVIDNVDRVPDGVEIIKNQTMDQCAIYIALAKKSFTFNNEKEEEYINYKEDENIIAYGELPSGEATSGDGYAEFTIPLKYKNFIDKPTHIIVVCSASKYGDYMTGGKGSLMYVDDFELIYDGEPSLQE